MLRQADTEAGESNVYTGGHRSSRGNALTDGLREREKERELLSKVTIILRLYDQSL